MRQKPINLSLDPAIRTKLLELAKERGLSLQELIRWILGDFTKYQSPPAHILPVATPPISKVGDDLMKFAKLQLRVLTKSGMFKCPNCTLSLTYEAITENKCQNCGTSLGGE